MSEQQKVCGEILAIMATFHEQEKEGNICTPGGLEHMGDVWKLLLKWEAMLNPATETIKISRPGYCPVCDWPFAKDRHEGCIPGDCSYRPREGSPEELRIRERRKQFKMSELAEKGSR